MEIEDMDKKMSTAGPGDRQAHPCGCVDGRPGQEQQVPMYFGSHLEKDDPAIAGHVEKMGKTLLEYAQELKEGKGTWKSVDATEGSEVDEFKKEDPEDPQWRCN